MAYPPDTRGLSTSYGHQIPITNQTATRNEEEKSVVLISDHSRTEIMMQLNEVMVENVSLKQKLIDAEETVLKCKETIESLEAEVNKLKAALLETEKTHNSADKGIDTEHAADIKTELYGEGSDDTIIDGAGSISPAESSDIDNCVKTEVNEVLSDTNNMNEEDQTERTTSEPYSLHRNIEESSADDIKPRRSKRKSNDFNPPENNGNLKYECGVCGVGFKVKRALKSHMVSHGDMKYDCGVCGLGFKVQQALRSHMVSHGEMKPFKCHLCEKKYSRAWPLKEHVRKHSESKPYACTQCDRKFAYHEYLKKHKERVHEGIEAPVYCCNICGKSYVNIKEHMKRHEDIEKTFECSICSRKFWTKSNLKEHMLTHIEEKAYCCAICGKLSASLSNHKVHSRLHTGERPHACNECPKRYITAPALAKHRLIHTGEKPFTCDTCGKQFRLSGGLKNHKLTHTGERPYSCALCDHRFVQIAHRNTHMKLVHGKKHESRRPKTVPNISPDRSIPDTTLPINYSFLF